MFLVKLGWSGVENNVITFLIYYDANDYTLFITNIIVNITIQRHGYECYIPFNQYYIIIILPLGQIYEYVYGCIM